MATIALHLSKGGKAVFSMEFMDRMKELGAWEHFVEESLWTPTFAGADSSKDDVKGQLLGAFLFKESVKGYNYWKGILDKL